MVVAGAALAVGGGVAGAVVVAPSMQPDAGSIAVRQAAGKDALATPQHTLQVARKARGMARGARQLANSLVGEIAAVDQKASAALDTANSAASTADSALSAADNALSTVNSTKSRSDTVSGTATVDNDTAYVADPSSPGPAVTVTVPPSGLIEVFASVRFETDGAVALFEDGNLVPIPGQEGVCTGGGPPEDALISSMGIAPITLGTPPAVSELGIACGSAGGAGGSLLIERAPGTHTYELRYSDPCSCNPAEFQQRTLHVAPRL